MATPATTRSKPANDHHSPGSPVVLSDDDDDNEPVAPSTAKRRRAARHAVVLDDDDDDSDEPVASSPVKRLRRGQEKEPLETPRASRHISEQARLDIEEDLEDLQDSGRFEIRYIP